MPPIQGRSLTQKEFAQLLGRAAERHTLGQEPNYTLAELIDAGAELDIDPETVRAIYAEHESARDGADLRQQKQLHTEAPRPLPGGSRLGLIEDADSLLLTLPPRTSAKVGAGVVVVLAALLPIGVTVAHPPAIVLFLAVALSVLTSYFAIQGARTTSELRLLRDGSGMLVRVTGGRSKTIALQAGQVRVRLDERISGNQHTIRRSQYVALDHGTRTYRLMEGWSRPEQAWAVERIQQWLSQRPARA